MSGLLGDLVGDAVPGVGQVGALAQFGTALLGALGLDPAAKAAAQAKLLEIQQTGELAQLAATTDLAKLQISSDASVDNAQINVDAAEAKSTSIFVAGWRPFIGWICGVGLGWHVFAAPLFTFADELCGGKIVAPTVPWDDLKWVLGVMLGFGGMRTWEKFKGVASGH